MVEPAGTIVISGYYGFANSGDEAVLHAILAALREEAGRSGLTLRPVVLSGNPAETARIHGVEAVHRMRPLAAASALRRADALVSGGGSLLQDVTSAKSMMYYLAVIRLARLLGKPVFVYAQGIGPVRRRSRFGPLIRSTLDGCEYISVRDDESKALLASFGLDAARVDVVPDPVMGLVAEAQPAERAGGESAIGVSVRFWREDREDLVAVASGLAEALAAAPGATCVFLPFHLPADREAAEFVADRIVRAGVAADRLELRSGTDHPDDMLRDVAGCDALVGMRLHSLIYAAVSAVPIVGISYDPKIEHFLHRLDMTPVGSTDSLAPADLSDAVVRLLKEGKAAWRAKTFAQIAAMQQNSRKPAQQIVGKLRI